MQGRHGAAAGGSGRQAAAARSPASPFARPLDSCALIHHVNPLRGEKPLAMTRGTCREAAGSPRLERLSTKQASLVQFGILQSTPKLALQPIEDIASRPSPTPPPPAPTAHSLLPKSSPAALHPHRNGWPKPAPQHACTAAGAAGGPAGRPPRRRAQAAGEARPRPRPPPGRLQRPAHHQPGLRDPAGGGGRPVHRHLHISLPRPHRCAPASYM